MIKINTSKCSTCTKKPISHKPNVTCDKCYSSYHARCADLSQGEALSIITSNTTWTCYPCMAETLPIGLLNDLSHSSLQNTVNARAEYLVMCNSCAKTLG